MHSVDGKLTLEVPYRPDGLYGLSKAWGEAMAPMYWDKPGIEGIARRIGSCEERPTIRRHLSTGLGYDDATELTFRCISASSVRFLAAWRVSNNTRAYWTPTASRPLGYYPSQDTEDYATEILRQPAPVDDTSQDYQGGDFVSIGVTPQQARRSHG